MAERFFSIAMVGVATLGLFFARQAKAQSAQPKISWSPPAITEVLGLGSNTSVETTFTSDTALQDVTLDVVPALVPFVTLQPSALASLAGGQAQKVSIFISVPSGTGVGVYGGTVHVRVGKQTAPQTLKITVVVTRLTVTVSVPENYQINSQVLGQGGPVLINNFGSQYQHGGFVPPNGAEITVTSNPLPRPPLSNFIWNELRGATINSTTSITVANTSCTEISYADSFGQTTNYSALAVYCPHNTTLYKFFLFYRAGDPGMSHFVAAFQQVLNTTQFTY
jgi:hypothetical protein